MYFSIPNYVFRVNVEKFQQNSNHTEINHFEAGNLLLSVEETFESVLGSQRAVIREESPFSTSKNTFFVVFFLFSQ